MKDALKNKKNITFAIWSIMVLPFLIAMIYSAPAADDFSNAMSFKANFSENYLKTALLQTKNLYMTWQGTYFGVFLLEFLSPILRGGIEMNRICCGIIVLLYAISSYYMSYVFFKVIQKMNVYITLLSWGLFFFCTTSFISMSESFYWFTGGCIYTVPVSFAFLAFANSMKCSDNLLKSKNILLGVLCSIFAAGGSLQITSLVCVGLLGIFLYSWIYLKRPNIYQLTIFGAGLLGGIVNVVAPGNYVRHDCISSEFHIIEALAWSFKSILKQICNLLLNTHIVVFFLILFFMLLLLLRNKKIEIKYPLMVMIYLCCGLLIIDFPVFLGYDGNNYFPLRCMFVELIAIIFFLIICAFVLASIITNRCIIRWNGQNIIIICIVLGLETLNICSDMSITDYTSVNILYRWINGDLSKYAQCHEDMFEILENGEKENVLVENVPDTMNIYSSIGIKTDKTDWVNLAISEYYDATSVQLMRPLQEVQSLDDYLIYLANNDYCSIIEINNSEIWLDDKYVKLFKDLGVNSEQITKDTDFFVIDEIGREDIECVSNFRQNGVQIDTSLGSFKMFMNETGIYGIYLNGEECYIAMPGEKENADIRIVVLSKDTKKKIDDVIFSYSIEKEKDNYVLSVSGVNRP